jgi:hypothetical protein
MKPLLFIHLLALLLIAWSCQLKKGKDGFVNFIPGTYIRFSQHEFGTEYDTLVISLQNSSTNEFKIIRKWKYERVLDGQPIEPEYKWVITAAIYSTENKFLRETETGDIYSFDTKEKLLFNGPIKYKKL